MRETPQQRLSDACRIIGMHYGVDPPSPTKLAELLPFLAEAVAAVLVELPPARAQGRARRAEQKTPH
jgi:hypothetical protein